MSRKATTKDKPTGRGGKRIAGPGKSLGRPRKYDEAVETRAVNLPPNAWELIDRLRGESTLSEWVFGEALHADLRR